MAHGSKDFWPGTSIAMPSAGSGQVPWFMSEDHLVPDGEDYDLISYVVPDTFELHVCSGVVSCDTPRTQRYDLRQTPAGTWISPTGFADPDDEWNNEERVYDGDIGTFCSTSFDPTSWSSFLILTINPTIIDKLRFYAPWYAATISKIDLDVDYGLGWTHVYEGAYGNKVWVEKDIGADRLVSKARIRFYNAAAYGIGGGPYEFQFNTAGVTPQEGIWFDTYAIIPYTGEAPYIVPPGATFVVKVYNDDDLHDANMSVALAGFLQPAII